MFGGSGRDRLDGGIGRDTLTGGSDADIFVIRRRGGRDRITDFQNGEDRIGLDDGLRFRNLTILQRGNNTLIRAGRDQLGVLVGIQANSINGSDFTIV